MNNFEGALNNNENKENKEEKEPVFNEETRIKLSESFMAYLKKHKIPDENTLKLREIVGGPDEYYESEEGLRIFRDSLNDLIKDDNFPDGKQKMTLKVLINGLSTFSLRNTLRKLKDNTISPHEASKLSDPIENPIDGLMSYTNSFKSIMSVLEEVLTPEVNLAVNAYAEEIFIKPLKHTIKNKGF